MSAPAITERHIDQMYTIIETLAVCGIILSDGEVTNKTCSSISWLLGQMKEQVGEVLTLVEKVQTAQIADADKPGRRIAS
ncbi:hypothetical protein ABFT80_06075 [Mesorhizobium sp. SB112]|uniref:hypothetical protein n=1 Tax=Mesorhizobium sp. SB112 TaxID=3151853 RepID=UPI0032660681